MSAFDFLIDPMSGRQYPDAAERTISGARTPESLAAAREIQRQFALVKAREQARVEALRVVPSRGFDIEAGPVDRAEHNAKEE